MKRIAYLVLVLMLAFLTACARQANQEGTEEPSQPETQQVATPAMNIEEIVAGNYASVAGVWISASGERLVFQNDGLATTSYTPNPASLTYYGTANMVVSPVGQNLREETFILEFIPAGVTIEEQVDYNGNVVFTDDSDSSRDRLWTGYGSAAYQEQGNFYYRLQ